MAAAYTDCTPVEAEILPAHIPCMNEKPHDQSNPHPTTPSKPTQSEPLEPREVGGPKGPEPTRYGDWEYNGRCTDF
jgi:hypothetical protein